MFKWIRKLFKREFYEGAKKTAANRDFWNANSPFEQTARGERGTLRARARWLSENNAIMHNIDNSILNNAIGTGITVQMRLKSKSRNNKIEEAFNRWAKSPRVDVMETLNWFDMQRVIPKNRMVDGEIFIYMIPDEKGLRLQLIEADALDTSAPGDGIERDEYGAPIYYHFKPMDKRGGSSTKSVAVPAKYVIHYFKKERPTQARGVSDYRQAILDIKNFSAFTSATSKGARARASIGYVVNSETAIGSPGFPPGDGTTDYENGIGPIQQIGDVDVFYLRPGESLVKTAPGSSDTEYNNFSEVVIRLIATARSVSYELAFKDFSKVNYSSSRASLMQDYKMFDEEQAMFTKYVYDRVFELWMQVEIMAGRLDLPLAKYLKDPGQFTKKRYIFPKRTLIDPLKEALAFEKEVELNMLTQSELAQRNGQDFEEIIAKKAEEVAILKQYGLYVPPEQTTSEDDSVQEIPEALRSQILEALDNGDVDSVKDMLSFGTPI